MRTMEEYRGQLFGGPDDGNFVEASVDRIPVVDEIKMWLDGRDKPVTIVAVNGTYVWQYGKNYYLWQRESVEVIKAA